MCVCVCVFKDCSSSPIKRDYSRKGTGGKNHYDRLILYHGLNSYLSVYVFIYLLTYFTYLEAKSFTHESYPMCKNQLSTCFAILQRLSTCPCISRLCTCLPGMATETFQGMPSILTLSCSGRVLPPDTKLMALVLFTVNRHNHHNHRSRGDDDDDNNIVASMDLIDGECYTSDSFSSCDIKKRDSKGSAVKTLVMGLHEDESRRFGCEVTSRRTGGRTQVYSWFLDVRKNREYTKSPATCFAVSVGLNTGNPQLLILQSL